MPDFLFIVGGAILGLIMGSFIGAIVMRCPHGESVVAGRSRCDSCRTPLAVGELVPIFSYIVQRGRCRTCRVQISPVHLYIEIVAALIGAAALFVAPGLLGLSGAVFGWFLLALAVLDAKYQWLPDALTYGLAGCGLLSAFFVPGPNLTDRLLGGVIGFASLAILAWLYRLWRKREGLGGGDPKLLGAIGCWLGWMNLPAVLLVASLAGLLVVGLLLLQRKLVDGSTALPLGSFLAIAAFPLWLVQTVSPMQGPLATLFLPA